MTISVLSIMFAAIVSQNIVLSQYQGICPFLGVSKKMSSAVGMGFAVIFVMAISAVFTWLIYNFILLPLELDYLYTMAFILVIASLVQMTEIILKKYSPTLYSALGVYLPLITTNCAVLGVALTNVQKEYNFIQSVFNGIGIAVGFTIAIVMLAGVREKIEGNDIPYSFQGMPIVLITSGLMAIAFFGFSGLI